MPVIDRVGRKKLSVRLFIAMLYVLLSAGAVTMVYPFLLMFSTSVTTEVDRSEFAILPRYLFDDKVLHQKFLYEKYSAVLMRRGEASYPLNEKYGTDYFSFNEIPAPPVDFSNPKDQLQIEDWNQFKKTLPMKYKITGFRLASTGGKEAAGKLTMLYRRLMSKRFKNDIKELNRVYIEELETFQKLDPPVEMYYSRVCRPQYDLKAREWTRIRADLPQEYFIVISGDAMWRTWLKIKYDSDIKRLNRQHNTSYRSFSELRLQPTLPEKAAQQPDWSEFIKTRWPLHYLEVNGAEEGYRRFLEEKYETISYLNQLYRTRYGSFTDITVPEPDPAAANDKNRIANIELTDWAQFIEKNVLPEQLTAKSSENRYREFLLKKYGSIDNINKNYGTDYRRRLQIPAPYEKSDLADIISRKTSWRKFFLTKNFAIVIDYILLHGRAVLNTAVFCLTMILLTLTVNPLCAFALSRFNLKGTHQVLLFLLATMAFPAEVAMIPNFLLLKELHLLNTYWALILPAAANGFSIFLLKGFFDSLPREVYEAATIDGASELRIFYQITIPLAKPVMAYLALGAFTAAYGAFMYALIVCQNSKMWTIMVWLYDMQRWASGSIQMAAFALATIPTLIIFIAAQKIIMQGIILPVEH